MDTSPPLPEALPTGLEEVVAEGCLDEAKASALVAWLRGRPERPALWEMVVGRRFARWWRTQHQVSWAQGGAPATMRSCVL